MIFSVLTHNMYVTYSHLKAVFPNCMPQKVSTLKSWIIFIANFQIFPTLQKKQGYILSELMYSVHSCLGPTLGK